jgi:glucokinase
VAQLPTGTDVVAAVDIGGTRVKAALVDGSYVVLAGTTLPTPPDIASDITAVVQAAVSGLLDTAAARAADVRLVGCGVVVPGLVDDERGIALLSVNLGWRDLPVGEPVAARLGVRTVVGHDVRAGLLAETRLGAAKGARHALFVAVGTGIAGALMLDGAIISAGGYAGELGHVVVDPTGPRCRCGAAGCLEAIASAAAVERAYAARSGRAAPAEEIASRTQAGDVDAVAVWEVATEALARAIVATVTITGVDLVLLGGGLAESGDVLLAPLRADVARRLTFQRPPRIVRAALGDRAGCLGAACLAWDAVHSREVS